MKDIRIGNTVSNAGVLTKEHELQLSKSGIYNNIVPCGKSIEEVFLGNLKSDFWEFQEQFVNEPKVMSIKCNQKKIFYTGSKKRKVKKVITTLEGSSMFYSLHTLKRYRERSWSNEEINIDDFHSIDDKWITKLSNNGIGSLVLEDKNKGSFRRDILVPYGDGAFLGHIGVMEWYSPNRVSIYTTTYRKGIPSYSLSELTNQEVFLPSFTTRTYIGREDFTWFQEQVFNQYHSNDWDDAIDTMKNNRMKEDHWDFNIRM